MPTTPSFRLTVVADADPVVLIRLVERIQSLALDLMRLSAERLSTELLSIELVGTGIDESAIDSLAKRIAQFATVHSAAWDLVKDTD